MKKYLAILLLSVTISPLVAQTNSVTLHPTFDASVGYHTGFNTANNNYNNVPQMSAYSIPGAAVSGENVNRALFGFDFSSIPAGSTIVSAYLSLYKNPGNSILNQHTIGNSQAWIQRINQSWNESTVTWNNQPAVTTVGQVTLAASQTGNEDYLNIDLTSLVQASYANPSSNYGYLLRLQSEVPNRALIFCSNNYQDANKRPVLVVNYCSNNSPLTITATGSTSFCEGGSVQLNVNANANFTWNDGGSQNPRTVSASGNYSVSSVSGCAVASNSVGVNVYPNPAQPVITPNGPLVFTEGGSVTLQSSLASAYSWLPNGGNTSSINVTQSGSFAVQIYDEHQCSAISAPVTVTVMPVVPPVITGCSAIEVIDYQPAKRNDGSVLPAERSITSNALGNAQNNDNVVPESQFNALTLGFGGSVTLRMSGNIANGPGNDLKVYETTYTPDAGNCQRYPERVRAFASQDGCNWVYLGEGCQDTEFDLGELSWAAYIRLMDVSPADAIYNNQVADGYDVDAVECLNGYKEEAELQDLGANYAMQLIQAAQGLRKNATPVQASRSDATKALGAPQNNNVVNFFSLGFGGSITLRLGYVVFNKDGNDLSVVETSYGNPACAAYPEKATIEISLDGSSWTSLGDICQDGGVDFMDQGIIAAQYIRITDHSATSQFSASADGYDVDGVVVLQPGCNASAAGIQIEDDITTKDETSMINVVSNVTKDNAMLQIATADVAEIFAVQLFSLTGQKLQNTSVSVAANSSISQLIDLSAFANGIYIISVQGTSSTETFKVIKQ